MHGKSYRIVSYPIVFHPPAHSLFFSFAFSPSLHSSKLKSHFPPFTSFSFSSPPRPPHPPSICHKEKGKKMWVIAKDKKPTKGRNVKRLIIFIVSKKKAHHPFSSCHFSFPSPSVSCHATFSLLSIHVPFHPHPRHSSSYPASAVMKKKSTRKYRIAIAKAPSETRHAWYPSVSLPIVKRKKKKTPERSELIIRSRSKGKKNADNAIC